MDDIAKSKVAGFFEAYSEREFAKGRILAHAGEDLPGVIYLADGRVSQYDIAASGNEVVVNVYKAPAFFPMSWAINKTPNQYFFKASTKVTARVAPPDEVVAWLKREPEVLFDLLSRVYRGTDGLLRRTAHMMGGDARSRLIYEMIIAAYRFGKQGDDDSWRIPLKEGELATQSGLARETANRVIRQLKEEKLVDVSTAGLVVPDMMRLQNELGADL